MQDFVQSGELTAQTKRLLGYRWPLALVIAVNIILLFRIPLPGPGRVEAHNLSASQQAELPLSAANTVPDSAASAEVTSSGAVDLASTAGQVAPLRSKGLLVRPPAAAPPEVASSEQQAVPALPSIAVAQEEPSTAAPAGASSHPPGLSTSDTPMAWSMPDIPLAAWQNQWQRVAKHWKASTERLLAELQDAQQHAIVQPPVSPEFDPRPDAPESSDPHSSPMHSVASEPQTSPAADPSSSTGLLVRNPQENGETVRFLMDRRLCELAPGEAHLFASGPERLVQFHRGGEFGNAQRTVTDGRYRFTSTPHGWDLVPE